MWNEQLEIMCCSKYSYKILEKIVVRYALKMFFIRTWWFEWVKIRIQIPIILKNIDTPKDVIQHPQ